MNNFSNTLLRYSLFILFYSVFFILMLSTASYAGDYHNQNSRRATQRGVTLACAQCHMMHGTQGGGDLVYSLVFTGGPIYIYPKLLRADTVVNLCKYCHGEDPYGIGAPILFSPTYNASGGDFGVGETFDGMCNSTSPMTITQGDKRHDIGCNVSSTPPPGFAATGFDDSDNIKDLSFWQNNVITRYGNGDGVFSCEYCHDQHGNTNYRNVRPTPYDPNDRGPEGTGVDGTYKAAVTYSNGSWDNLSSIVQSEIGGDADGSDASGQFSTSNITFRSSADQIAGFCGKCHINFYGAPGDINLGGSASGDTASLGDEWRRHPVGGISVGIGNGHTDPQPDWDTNFPVPNNTAPRVINPAATAGDEQPFCLTCHRVHGSRNHTNLIFGGPGTLTRTDGGGWGTMMRDTCQQCHNQ